MNTLADCNFINDNNKLYWGDCKVFKGHHHQRNSDAPNTATIV